MRKLLGVLAVLALTVFAAAPSAASYPGYFYCEEPLDCPEFRDCYVTGCWNNTCTYDCWW